MGAIVTENGHEPVESEETDGFQVQRSLLLHRSTVYMHNDVFRLVRVHNVTSPSTSPECLRRVMWVLGVGGPKHSPVSNQARI